MPTTKAVQLDKLRDFTIANHAALIPLITTPLDDLADGLAHLLEIPGGADAYAQYLGDEPSTPTLIENFMQRVTAAVMAAAVTGAASDSADTLPPMTFTDVRALPEGRAMWMAFCRHAGIANPEDDETIRELPDSLIAEFMAPAVAKLEQLRVDAAAVTDDLPSRYRNDDHPLAVNDASKAAWVVNKFKSMDADIERVEHETQAMLKAMRAEAERFKRVFTPSLREWAGNNKERKVQFARTAAGKVGFRNKAGDLKLGDANAAMAWVREQGKADALIKTKTETSLDWATLKAQLKAQLKANADGELDLNLPPGVVYVEPSEEFFVEGVKL